MRDDDFFISAAGLNDHVNRLVLPPGVSNKNIACQGSRLNGLAESNRKVYLRGLICFTGPFCAGKILHSHDTQGISAGRFAPGAYIQTVFCIGRQLYYKTEITQAAAIIITVRLVGIE